jgi:hypothetical protein
MNEEKLTHIRDLKYQSFKIVKYLEQYSEELVAKKEIKKIQKQAAVMNNCMKKWELDLYKKNKVAHIKKIEKCYNKFCYNCRVVEVARNISEFLPKHELMIEKGYVPLMVTFTVKNVKSNELTKTINKLFIDFGKMVEKLSRSRQHGGIARPFDLKAAFSTLEINRNFERDDWQPHLHGIFYIEKLEYENGDFKKYIKAEFQKRSQTYKYISEIDLYLRCLWTLVNGNKVDMKAIYHSYLGEKDGETILVENNGLLKADITEVTDGYILEVMKYTYKMKDINNYEDFKVLYRALWKFVKTRFYGELFNLVIEDIEEKEKEDISQYLLEKEISINEIHDLDYIFTMVRKYDYKIVSTSSLTNIIDKYKLFSYE